MSEQKATFDLGAMRRAIENLDADALIRLYANDAELRIVNRYTTPSPPRELRGNEEIAEYLRDVCGRVMYHRIENEVVGEDRTAFDEACEYEDGTRVLAATTPEVRDGKTSRRVNVEAWDEQEKRTRRGSCYGDATDDRRGQAERVRREDRR